ncbi:glycosyltransferase [Desulfosporosinus sp. PR]|uniref:glycosyltransferase n=1 Tax=Candidatus Desulfosporosinus nitrosoreducens TaxID=3401928 RepID=UPI0027EAAE87|nr:glycosyltransferase [Desulfosporosinus sp. PR]MDQ7097168.1 glycosyltransferase [Desulfosporosinus sp. PR]
MDDRISLTMIVKDEQAHLAACLDRVRDQVDEIIIVDTGSADDTVAIARRYTPHVFLYPWKGDFSAARNYAISKASCAWIFCLDADEVFLPETGNLREILRKHQGCEAFLLPLENPTVDAAGYVNRFHVLRLFKNKDCYRFFGIIHEQVKVRDARLVQIVQGPILRHRIPSPTLRKRKRARNLKLLHRALSRDPQNPFLHYYLGLEWLMLNKPEKSLPYLKVSYELLTDDNLLLKAPALRCLVICLKSLGKFEEALILCLEADFKYPEFTDIYFLAGTLWAEKGEFALAIKWLKQALQCGEPPAVYSHMLGAGSFLSHYYLGYCYDMLGDGETACRHYEAALALNSQYTLPLPNLFLNLRVRKGFLAAYNYFADQGFFDNLEFSLILAEEFFQAAYPGWAKEILQRHVFELEAKGKSFFYQVFFNLGRYALCAGELKKARDFLGEIPPESEFYGQGQVEVIFSLLLGGYYNEARDRALSLWQQGKLRAEAYLALKLIKGMQNEDVKLLLPETIRGCDLSTIGLAWFREMLGFLPPLSWSPQYSCFLRSLQSLLVNLSPQSAGEMINLIAEKKKETEASFKYKFGGILP